jgi:hypothetical protein
MTIARVVAENVLTPHPSRPAAPRGAVGLGAALVVAGVVSAAATLAWPGLLTGTAVMNGSARGTALVVLVLAVPMLAASLAGLLGPSWSVVGAVGATSYLLYNAVLLAFATPLNHVFLAYVAMLGLAFWTLVVLVHDIGVGATGGSTEHRVAAVWIFVVVALNAVAWLAAVVPATLGDHPASVLDGTGLTTNPVYVQDLALWLPAMAWVAVQLWQGRARLLGAGALVFWALEGIGVAVDQWWGHAADPTSGVASATAVPLFVVVAAVTAVVARMLLRDAPRT